MVTINCQNTRISESGDTVCHRILAGIPQWIIEGLRDRAGKPDGKIVLRCPSCPHDGRFSEISFDIEGKSHFTITHNPIEIESEMQFDVVSILRQIK